MMNHDIILLLIFTGVSKMLIFDKRTNTLEQKLINILYKMSQNRIYTDNCIIMTKCRRSRLIIEESPCGRRRIFGLQTVHFVTGSKPRALYCRADRSLV